MPIIPPRLDDRSFPDLVEELLSRIPGHTPEWTHARVGDPGRTLLELFAWLADSILYRANLIPERQRLAFLRLLGASLRPAEAASGVVSVHFDTEVLQPSVSLRAFASLRKPVPFETLDELTVVHLTAEAYRKRPLTETERQQHASMLPRLAQVYGLDPKAQHGFYATTPVFPLGAADPRGLDLVTETVDGSLWLALLAPKAEHVAALREDLTKGNGQGPRVLSVGVSPVMEVPALSELLGARGRLPHVWEVTGTPAADGLPVYHRITVVADSTQELSRRGVVRLLLPSDLGAPVNDVRTDSRAGLGDRPPRLDDPRVAARLVTWLRLRPSGKPERFALGWVDINAVEVDQRETTGGRLIGQSDGSAEQEFRLPSGSVERATFQLFIEEPGAGYREWRLIEDLALARRDEPVYALDSEAGAARCGDGVRGRVPPAGAQVLVARMRSGGGAAGNLPPGSLKDISAFRVDGSPAPGLRVQQPEPTLGGRDAETLAEAERRIPALLRHVDRAVTEEDYRRLAASTPGVQLGRVEVLPRFEPRRRRDGVPGVVSVMVLPTATRLEPPYPRADRPLLEAVHAYLDARRPLTTELYVIGCEYVPLGLGVGITVREGFGRETVVQAVRQAVRRFIFPLPAGGPTGEGWPLGRDVQDRELYVAVAQVPGVASIAGVSLFAWGTVTRVLRDPRRAGATADVARFTVEPPAPSARQAEGPVNPSWLQLKGSTATTPVELSIADWQLPELLKVAVNADGEVPTMLHGIGDEGSVGVDSSQAGVAVPMVPEVC
ncbi:putative baseplate assembly protein [Myxococcus xanthus]|uniref:putative baseplate assembly protein n=1 Tax=Myxococcus xanthus TaxID=34 RepID=UPI00112C722C|nr:putative baseplate assembly protein [Myxococcus xanthus]QDE84165.1 putative baseplate assembly protein [Myxococcus xanthus]